MKKNLKIVNDSMLDECGVEVFLICEETDEGEKVVAVVPYRDEEEQEQALLKCQEILSINDEED